ncbi:MAG TPA: hypothetical protein VIF43_03415 [Patescibacteria group bacterium]|jgi:hypothetical protein
MKADSTRSVLTVVAGIMAVTVVVLVGLAVTYPEVLRQSSLGAEFFLADLGAGGRGLGAVTGFKPAADGFLLLGSYVLVCLIAWSQMKFKEYLKTRGHF